MLETQLVDALYRRQRDYSEAIDRLRELATDKTENDEVYEATSTLREAIALVGCLRRLTQGRTPDEIHRAFGAPGDFGYETPIGDALHRFYRAAIDEERSRAAAQPRCPWASAGSKTPCTLPSDHDGLHSFETSEPRVMTGGANGESAATTGSPSSPAEAPQEPGVLSDIDQARELARLYEEAADKVSFMLGLLSPRRAAAKSGGGT